MTDFYTVLKNSIIKRGLHSADDREQVYNQARQAMVQRLWSFDPPLSEDEIDTRIGLFDAAVEKIEVDLERTFRAETAKPRTETARDLGKPAPMAAKPKLSAPPPRVQRPAPPPAPEPDVYEGYDQEADYAPAHAGNSDWRSGREEIPEDHDEPEAPPSRIAARSTRKTEAERRPAPAVSQPPARARPSSSPLTASRPSSEPRGPESKLERYRRPEPEPEPEEEETGRRSKVPESFPFIRRAEMRRQRAGEEPASERYAAPARQTLRDRIEPAPSADSWEDEEEDDPYREPAREPATSYRSRDDRYRDDDYPDYEEQEPERPKAARRKSQSRERLDDAPRSSGRDPVRMLTWIIVVLAALLIAFNAYVFLPLLFGPSSPSPSPSAPTSAPAKIDDRIPGAGADASSPAVQTQAGGDSATAVEIPERALQVAETLTIFDGRDPTVFEGTSGNPIQFDSDTDGGFARVASSASAAGARAVIGPGLAERIAGKTIRVTLLARSSRENGTDSLRFAYQSGVAISHWQSADLSGNYGTFGMIWRVPSMRTNSASDYLLIEPGVPGDGTRADIRSIKIDVVAS